MDSRTINPLIMVGSYAGLLAGILLSLKGWNIFWWVPALFGINLESPMLLNAIGGFVLGYVLHILWRIGNFHAGRMAK